MATLPNESANTPPENPWPPIIVGALFVLASVLIFAGVLYHPPADPASDNGVTTTNVTPATPSR